MAPRKTGVSPLPHIHRDQWIYHIIQSSCLNVVRLLGEFSERLKALHDNKELHCSELCEFVHRMKHTSVDMCECRGNDNEQGLQSINTAVSVSIPRY